VLAGARHSNHVIDHNVVSILLLTVLILTKRYNNIVGAVYSCWLIEKVVVALLLFYAFSFGW
jgi:hypothetical protein